VETLFKESIVSMGQLYRTASSQAIIGAVRAA
jgi:hypothetical protein